MTNRSSRQRFGRPGRTAYRIGDRWLRRRWPERDYYTWGEQTGHELALFRDRPPTAAALKALRRGAVALDAAVVGDPEAPPLIALAYRVGDEETWHSTAYVPEQTASLPPAEAHGATLRIVLVTGGIIQASSIVPIPPVVAGCLHRAIRAQAKAIRAAEARLTEIRGTLPYVLAALRRLGRCQENGGRKR